MDNDLDHFILERTEIKDMNLVQYRPDPVKQPWAAGPSPADNSPLKSPFTVYLDSWEGYSRRLPVEATGEKADLLLRSIIKNYAIEGSNNGKPSGIFYVDKNAYKRLCSEVINTHMGSKH